MPLLLGVRAVVVAVVIVAAVVFRCCCGWLSWFDVGLV